MENCKSCIYSNNCYHEKCYTQMRSVYKDYTPKKKDKVKANE